MSEMTGKTLDTAAKTGQESPAEDGFGISVGFLVSGDEE